MKPMTQENLKAAFAGESQAHVKYLAFAARAERQRLPNVARLFRAVAAAETAHAHYHLNQLKGIGTTAENLQAAFEGEDFEIEHMYPAFVAVAQLEGEKGAVRGYHYAVEAEKQHRPLYEDAKQQVEAGGDLDETPIYVCGMCGHTGRGEVPAQCPVCSAHGDVFEVF